MSLLGGLAWPPLCLTKTKEVWKYSATHKASSSKRQYFLAADLYNKIYDPENGMGIFETNHTIRDLAITFEKNLDWSSLDDDEGRYFEELEKFENEYLESHNKINAKL